MGYVPPKEPLSVLIRADLEPMLGQLYNLSRIMDVSNQYMRRGPRLNGYERYINDLYGERPRDWFLVWNYLVLACLIALVVIGFLWWAS